MSARERRAASPSCAQAACVASSMDAAALELVLGRRRSSGRRRRAPRAARGRGCGSSGGSAPRACVRRSARGGGAEARDEQADQRLRAVDEPAHVIVALAPTASRASAPSRASTSAYDRRARLLEERLVEAAVAHLARQVARAPGCAGAAERDQPVEQRAGLRRGAVAAGVRRAAARGCATTSRHLLLDALVRLVDAQQRLARARAGARGVTP